jgi:hypothetical protein
VSVMGAIGLECEEPRDGLVAMRVGRERGAQWQSRGLVRWRLDEVAHVGRASFRLDGSGDEGTRTGNPPAKHRPRLMTCVHKSSV